MKKNFLIVLLFLYTFISSCSVNKAKINNDLKKYFDSAHVDGCFAIVDNSSGAITIYNMKLDTQRVLPASTFKIVNSLIGLETGKITDEKMVIKWDSIKRWNNDWNKDLTMEETHQLPFISGKSKDEQKQTDRICKLRTKGRPLQGCLQAW